MINAINKLISNCYNEIGYKANDAKPPYRYNKYAEYLDSLGNIYNGKKNGYHWCDIFVDYMFIYSFGVDVGMQLMCQPYRGLGAGCTFSARYYQNKNQLMDKPERGDQIFFGNYKNCNHTGIVVDVDDTYVYTIEGNSNNSVAKRKYKLNDTTIYKYGRPNWNLIRNIDRYKTIDDIPKGFYRDSIKKLIDLKYISGKGNNLDLTEDMVRCLIISARMCGVL